MVRRRLCSAPHHSAAHAACAPMPRLPAYLTDGASGRGRRAGRYAGWRGTWRSISRGDKRFLRRTLGGRGGHRAATYANAHCRTQPLLPPRARTRPACQPCHCRAHAPRIARTAEDLARSADVPFAFSVSARTADMSTACLPAPSGISISTFLRNRQRTRRGWRDIMPQRRLMAGLHLPCSRSFSSSPNIRAGWCDMSPSCIGRIRSAA